MDKAAAGPETVVTAVNKMSRLTDKVVTEANTVVIIAANKLVDIAVWVITVETMAVLVWESASVVIIAANKATAGK